MPFAYVFFIVFVFWAVRRAPPWCAAVMIGAPPALAVILTSLLIGGFIGGPTVLLSSLPCAALVVIGIYLKSILPNSSQALRLLGWSIVAGIVLIPASTVLLAPFAGLAAFLVPDSRRKVQPAQA
jgi:hypothetical protein